MGGREGCSDFDEAQTKLPQGGSNKPSGGLGAVEPARLIRQESGHGGEVSDERMNRTSANSTEAQKAGVLSRASVGVDGEWGGGKDVATSTRRRRNSRREVQTSRPAAWALSNQLV